MPLMLGSKTYDPVDNFNTTPGLFDLHPAIGLYFASAAGHVLVSAASPLPVTPIGGGDVTDTDDNSLVSGQTTGLEIIENYIFDGTVWIRQMGGIDNAVAPASPQGSFIAGIVTDPLDVFTDGDISFLHFDTSGRLLVNAEGVTDTDDNSIAAGQTTGLSIDLSYLFDGTVWIRQMGGIDNAVAPASPQGCFVAGIVTDPLDVFADGDISFLHFDTSGRLLTTAAISLTTDTDDNLIASGQILPLFINENYVHDGTNWIRWQGGVDNAVAPATPQVGFVGGKVTSPLDVYADGDASGLNFNTRGRVLVQPRGATITAGANTAVGVGATVALPALPVGTLAITVQNKTAGGASRVLIRQVGGAAGTGISLATLGTITFDNAVAALEAENIAGPAASVGIIFESE